MKKTILSLLALTIFLLPVSVLAQNASPFSQNKRVVLEADQIVDKDYFAAGETVEIHGTVNGDVYVAAGQIIVDGVINGDLIAAGGQITVSGTISQNVRIVGGQITIDGQIGRNLTVGAGDVQLENSANINGSVVIGAGNVTIRSPLNSNLTVGTGNLVISSPINGNVEAGVGNLTLSSGASISGNLDYWSDQEANINPDASVSGAIRKHTTPSLDLPQTPTRKFSRAFTRGGKATTASLSLFSLTSSLIIALLLLRFFPRCTQMAASIINKKPWPSLGIGFATLILTPFAFIFLLITVLGIPLAFVLIFTYILFICLGKIYVALWLGNFLVEKTKTKLKSGWIILIGLIAYAVITKLPVVGGLVSLLGLLVGLGATVLCTQACYRNAKKKDLV